MFHFVMPADGLERSKIEGHFRPQADLLRQRGQQISIIADAVFRRGEGLDGIPSDATVVYRGWMVTLDEYARFEQAILDVGAKLLTNSATYRLTHHLPGWYSLLQEWTAETVIVSSADELFLTLTGLHWEAYFLKDFVKSLKVGGGSIVKSSEEVKRWVEEMLYYRDEFEGGICIRRVEDFEPESECRFFVLNGKPFGPDDRVIPLPVAIAASRIPSSFFTVDVARNRSGVWRIVELGDGQVSDLVGWTPERFAEMWKK